MPKLLRYRQKVFVLGNGDNTVQKGLIVQGMVMLSEPCAMPLQWYLKEGDKYDNLHRIYFKDHNVFVNVYSKHIYLTEEEAKQASIAQ